MFSDELLERISDVIDPAKIDYIISNHVEMDHSGALPAMVKACPNATIITSAPSGLKGLTAQRENGLAESIRSYWIRGLRASGMT